MDHSIQNLDLDLVNSRLLSSDLGVRSEQTILGAADTPWHTPTGSNIKSPIADDATERHPPSKKADSPFFNLPSEVRINIWRSLLVKTKIYISFTNCRLLPAQRGARRKQRAVKEVSDFDENHVEYYGVLDEEDNEEAHVGTYFSPRRSHDDWAGYVANCLATRPPKFVDDHHVRPRLDIFRACSRIRNEAEPIFYSENCFVFCTCNQHDDYNAARDISAAHAACSFFEDRSPQILRDIKHIELHVLSFPRELPGVPLGWHFPDSNMKMWREMAKIIKSKMNLQRLSIRLGGWVPEIASERGIGNYLLRTAVHPEIDELFAIPQVKRLSICFTTAAVSLAVCDRHGEWCFTNTRNSPCCPLASECLAALSFIKSLRCKLLASGKQLGISRIRGGLLCGAGSVHLIMESDDSCEGSTIRTHLIPEENTRMVHWYGSTPVSMSLRWANDPLCMEMVSDDFHESLNTSRALNRAQVRPPRKEVTFHMIWVDGLGVRNATLALDCEQFWGNKNVREELGLNITRPSFATGAVQKTYEVDPRKFQNIGEWRDALRHALQFPSWALDFVDAWIVPRAVEETELDASFPHDLPGQAKCVQVCDVARSHTTLTWYGIQNEVENGEANQTILFTCQPAWACLHKDADPKLLWETEMYSSWDLSFYVDRTTGLLLEY